MRTELMLLSALMLLLVFVPAVYLLARIARDAIVGHPWSAVDKRILGVCLLLWVCLSFRPHGDTFTALDNSGYRLMAYGFLQGRGLHEEDRMLMAAPRETRQALMYLPHMKERNTRDISFEIRSLDQPRTAPFFYPLVPLMAAGVDRFMPFMGMDLLIPLFGLLFIVALGVVGWRTGHLFGSVLAFVLAIGSPLPMWLFRGFYTEAAGAACTAVAMALWYTPAPTTSCRACAGLLLGLAVSFHPVYIVIAVPLVATLALDTKSRTGASFVLLFCFCAGFSVLVAMTEWICSPYGSFALKNMIFNFRASATHRLVLLFGMGGVLAFSVGLCTRSFWLTRLPRITEKLSVRVLLLAIAALPLLYAATTWQYAGLVRTGLQDVWLGLRWPLAVLLAVGTVVTTLRVDAGKPFVVLLIFAATLPVFVYLKGAEQVGLWSQRRLLPPYTLLILAILPGLASGARVLAKRRSSRYPIHGLLLGAGLVIAAFHNMVRWPAPYFVRVDHGALEFVQRIRADAGDRLVMFDYHPFSCPFAVDNRTHAIALGQRSRAALGGVSVWLAEKAREEEVLWATAFGNPGMEEGVSFETVSVHTGSFARVASRGLLPAKRRQHDIRIELMRAVPLLEPTAGIVMDKVMDAGPLALREPWGQYRRTLRDANGQVLPVEWSRHGSGIVGPVPPAGGSVLFSLWAESGQDVPQTIRIVPPWGEDHAVSIQISPEFSLHTVRVPYLASVPAVDPTGIYRLQVPEPYDPATRGIRGFASDLGVLVHRIRIESASPDTTHDGNVSAELTPTVANL